MKNGVCSFTVSQNICVAVPVEFGVNAVVGEAYVDCLGVSSEDICTDCALSDGKTELLPDIDVQGRGGSEWLNTVARAEPTVAQD